MNGAEIAAAAREAAERAWVVRYAAPDEMASIVVGLPAGPGRQVLLGFAAWRRQELGEAVRLTATLGYDPAVSHRWRARALDVRGNVLTELGLARESFEVRRLALEQARLGRDRVAQISCVHDFGVLYEQTDPLRAQQQYLQTLRLIENAHDVTTDERRQLDALRGMAVVNLYWSAREQGLAVPHWVPSLQDVRYAVRDSWPDLHTEITAVLGREALEAGDMATASRLGAQCPDPLGMRDVAVSPAVASLKARLLAADGDVAGAVRLLRELCDRLPTGRRPEALEALMRVYEDAGDYRAAFGVAQELIEADRRVHRSTTANTVRALEVLYRTEDAEALARRATVQARVATRTLDTLQEERTRDDLTGTRNRRHLVTVAPDILALPGAAVAVVDIDHFKLVNDRYGHLAGDAVLQRVAGALARVTRPEDVVARYGGDEFVVLRPAGGGQSLADDLRAVTSLHDVHPGDEEDAPPVTLSIGIADTCARWDATLSVADEAMYRIKRAGGAGIHHAA